MKKKDIYIIALVSIFLSTVMIFFHSNKTSKIVLDKSKNTKKEEHTDDIEISSNASDIVTSKKVVVYISGEVVNPQVIEMKEGDRLIDAVEKCGGMTDYADKNAVNLALLLSDEGHYIIPKKGEQLQISGNVSSSSKNNLININTADKTALMSLPNFGEKTAERIIQYRENKGKFETIDDLKNVSGIGEKKFEQVKDLITVK